MRSEVHHVSALLESTSLAREAVVSEGEWAPHDMRSDFVTVASERKLEPDDTGTNVLLAPHAISSNILVAKKGRKVKEWKEGRKVDRKVW